jgi:two-component system, cell cycle sensor histidine kinase and response regulator CckA
VRWREFEHGGRFAALEAPSFVVAGDADDSRSVGDRPELLPGAPTCRSVRARRCRRRSSRSQFDNSSSSQSERSRYTWPVGDGNGELVETSDAYGEASLSAWRVRLLNGILLTSVIAILPGAAVQLWQWRQEPFNPQSGLVLTVVGLGTLIGLARWRGSYKVRAALLIALGCVLTPVALWTQGLSPGHFVAICALTTVSVLLYSARAAFLMLGVSTVLIALTGFLFVKGYATPIPQELRDERLLLNWLRAGFFWLFPSTLAAVATSFLLEKLQDTLRVRGRLVYELREEVARRERAHEELARTQQQLVQAQKLEAIGQLAAGIAHDFNNTLAVVALEAEVLKRRRVPDESVAHAAEALLSASERGKHLTRQLLMFSRSEHVPRPVIECRRAFAEGVQALQRLLPSEVTFELEVASEPIFVCIAPSELQHIVLNLGINARDAMPNGGGLSMSLLRTDLTKDAAAALALRPGPYALLSCRDTGVGMDAATLARLFEPFFTTKAAGRGTGLGLTNVWNIAKRALGTVCTVSEPGGGATLHVYLPISDAAPATIATRPSAEQPLGAKTVFVVEDDIRVRALLVTLLVDAGYKTLEAANVDAALVLERQYSGPIHLLCTDVVMPGRPTRELIAHMREHRPGISVLVCSGYSEDQQILRGIRGGELKLLSKPFTRQALLSAVRTALES